MSEVKPIRGRFTQMLEDERAPTSHERAPTSHERAPTSHERAGFPQPGLRPNVSPQKRLGSDRNDLGSLEVENLTFRFSPGSRFIS